MNKKVLVLGGGQMGSVIAQYLSGHYETKIADINPDLCDIQFDISSANKIEIKETIETNNLIEKYSIKKITSRLFCRQCFRKSGENYP